jgi:membrane-bound ClpP family serine protease
MVEPAQRRRPLQSGSRVRVRSVEGLELVVEQVSSGSGDESKEQVRH